MCNNKQLFNLNVYRPFNKPRVRVCEIRFKIGTNWNRVDETDKRTTNVPINIVIMSSFRIGFGT